MKTTTIRNTVILALICGLFVFHSIKLEYTQDDAYISYRYVENFLDGHGLVFNYGERVEGYTNFLWIMILSLTTMIGLPIILTSKVLGIVFGVGTLVITYLLSKEYVDYKRWYLAFFAPLLLAINQALAFWTIGGLETAMFIFLAMLVLYCEIKTPRLTPFILVIATITRPEGGLLFGIIFLYRLFISKVGLKLLAQYTAIYIGLLIPYAVFKLMYFGDLLPNPFYAKTGFSKDYLVAGLEYTWRFLKNYGAFGTLFLLPLFFLKKLPNEIKLLWMTVLIYTLYIIIVGGDVLKVHRFFLPLLPLLYIILVFTAINLFQKFSKEKLILPIIAVFILGYAVWCIFIPWEYIRHIRWREKGLIMKMDRKIGDLLRFDRSNFSLATTTIGKAAYMLKGHKVIDMLGLTDPNIAKNPELIEGLESTWKERNFNVTYLLGQKPDYILFSTGYKPSAPAERALMLSSQFRKNYTTVIYTTGTKLTPTWKRTGDFSEPNEMITNLEYAELLHDFYNVYGKNDYQAALKLIQRIMELGKNDFYLEEYLIGTCYMYLNQAPKAIEHFYRSIEMNPECFESRLHLYILYNTFKDTTNARIMYDQIREMAPWYDIDRIK